MPAQQRPPPPPQPRYPGASPSARPSGPLPPPSTRPSGSGPHPPPRPQAPAQPPPNNPAPQPPPAAPRRSRGRAEPWTASRLYSYTIARLDMAIMVVRWLENLIMICTYVAHLFEKAEHEPEVIWISFAYLFSVITLFALIEVYIASDLLIATDPATPVEDAIDKAKWWRFYRVLEISVILFVALLTIVQFEVVTSRQGSTVGFLIFVYRVVSVCIVHWFILDLHASQNGG